MSMSFSSTKEVVPFEMVGDVGRELFVLVEMNGLERDKYLKQVQARIEMTRSGKAKIKDIEGMQAIVVVFSARRVKAVAGYSEVPSAEELDTLIKQGTVRLEDLQLERLKSEEVQAWPSKMQGAIADRATELSGLNKNARDDEKND